jgi:copper chaperone
MTSTTYRVQGMTCDHCARAVTEEVTKIEGVTDVAVDVGAGQVTVTSSAPLGSDAVREAVDEAGYELVGA